MMIDPRLFKIGDRVEEFTPGCVTVSGMKTKFDSIGIVGTIVSFGAIKERRQGGQLIWDATPSTAIILVDPSDYNPEGSPNSRRTDQIRFETTPAERMGLFGGSVEVAIQMMERRDQARAARRGLGGFVANLFDKVTPEEIATKAALATYSEVRRSAATAKPFVPVIRTHVELLRGRILEPGDMVVVNNGTGGGPCEVEFICEANGWYFVKYWHGGSGGFRAEHVSVQPKRKAA